MHNSKEPKKINIDLDDLDSDAGKYQDKISIDLPPENKDTVKTRGGTAQQPYQRDARTAKNNYATNQNVAGERLKNYPKADFGKRIVAYIIDAVIAYVPGVIFSFVIYPAMLISAVPTDPFAAPSSPGLSVVLAPLLMLVVYLAGFVYFLVKDGMGKGQSLGKKIMGLMVIRVEDNQPCTKGSSALRNIILYFIGVIEAIVALAVNDKGHRLGDMAAKTQVIEVAHYN